MVDPVTTSNSNTTQGPSSVPSSSGTDYVFTDTPVVNAINVFSSQVNGMREEIPNLQGQKVDASQIKEDNIKIAQQALAGAAQARARAQEQEGIMSETLGQIVSVNNGITYLKNILPNYDGESQEAQVITALIEQLEKKKIELIEKFQEASRALLEAKEEERAKLKEALEAALKARQNGERIDLLGIRIEDLEAMIKQLEDEIEKLKKFLGVPIEVNIGKGAGPNVPPSIGLPPPDVQNPLNLPIVSYFEGKSNQEYENAKLFRSMFEVYRDNPILAGMFARQVEDSSERARSYANQAQSLSSSASSTSTQTNAQTRDLDLGQGGKNQEKTVGFGGVITPVPGSKDEGSGFDNVDPLSANIESWKESLGANDVRVV